MEIREKVRILLFNPAGDILLMRIEDPHSQELGRTRDITTRWITIGGGIEPGETITQAARREAHEETGVSDIEIGAFRDYREITFSVHGAPVLFKENYISATTGSWQHDYSGWTEEERTIVKELRWWSRQDIRNSDEIFFPHDLEEMMRQALA
jgi:8-oxo-dGTP pyrophosphatase MutT (NUDIX family)